MASGWLTGMRQYESAFLGLILAGVVMMVIGVGLIVMSQRSTDSHTTLAERLADRPPSYANRTIDSPPARR